jgi:trans-aconitate 2-methyltransferase
MASTDTWNPDQYQRFAAERAQPFHDLLGLVHPQRGARVVDLGCGTGELTVALHRHVRAATTLGLDASPAMLERAAPLDEPGVTFELGDITAFDAPATYDVVFANASLQWVPDHEHLLGRLLAALRPGGQLAVQVPANADHPSHTLAVDVAREEPFLGALGGEPPPDMVDRTVLAPERYAEILDGLGVADQHVRLQVYGHRLARTAEVAEWTKGTTLTRFRDRLPDALFDRFVDRYRERLVDELGDRAPYFYPFKRILVWGRMP